MHTCEDDDGTQFKEQLFKRQLQTVIILDLISVLQNFSVRHLIYNLP